MIPATFYFTDNGNLYGTTTNGATFSQITILETPKIQKFELSYEKDKLYKLEWFVCEDGIKESLQDCIK